LRAGPPGARREQTPAIDVDLSGEHRKDAEVACEEREVEAEELAHDVLSCMEADEEDEDPSRRAENCRVKQLQGEQHDWHQAGVESTWIGAMTGEEAVGALCVEVRGLLSENGEAPRGVPRRRRKYREQRGGEAQVPQYDQQRWYERPASWGEVDVDGRCVLEEHFAGSHRGESATGGVLPAPPGRGASKRGVIQA